jgi:hypothetical protein
MGSQPFPNTEKHQGYMIVNFPNSISTQGKNNGILSFIILICYDIYQYPGLL